MTYCDPSVLAPYCTATYCEACSKAKYENERRNTTKSITYILKKDCPNIGKETGDYYNGEYAESVEELLVKGIIEEENEI